ncbi:dTDP-4-dehydrorhamnose reductase [Paenimyroides tangerinum]|uniref:dTDP-4-dehydrorhamnose reductase n=1 Tax=Paenimyroides tangerinum TaxID=2488728 RepID=A0A3P3VU63_9FLAO|nr:dTDP-4-dehydrorhamnose reductase [Paenimyroides tangerinum]RRJ86345.1 dTDP-4-dehydrorhamnose reductase [Paenimyroides tangerinum]
MKTLITGSNGQLGQCIKEISEQYPTIDFVFVSRKELDITKELDVKAYFESNKFDFVINCAAYTAVDKAESDIENARLVNATATKYLAQSSAKQNIPFIHISTDYVFDGMISEPRKETDEVNPINIYGQTKLEGEELALAINPRTIIIRTSWVYSNYGNNFVKTMLRLFQERKELNVINDQIGSPTNALDLAEALIQIVLSKKITYGIFNYSNEGKCSWFDFALKIKEQSNSNITINPIPTTAYPTPAKRPIFSLLDKSKIKTTYQISVPDWENSLERMMNQN